MVDSVKHFEGCTCIGSIVEEEHQCGKPDRGCIDRGDNLGFGISIDIREDLGRIQERVDLV